MATHVQGIAITIKAFLPTGKTIDEQFEALSIVKDAHATGDYSKVLAKAKIDEVKSEQKTRRIEDEAQGGATIDGTANDTTEGDGGKQMDIEDFTGEPAGTIGGAQMEGNDEPGATEDEPEGIPAFLLRGKSKSAAA